jgi:hypothetical protein
MGSRRVVAACSLTFTLLRGLCIASQCFTDSHGYCRHTKCCGMCSCCGNEGKPPKPTATDAGKPVTHVAMVQREINVEQHVALPTRNELAPAELIVVCPFPVQGVVPATAAMTA